MLKLAILLLLPLQAMAQPAFRRLPEIPHQYTGGWEHFVGGGVAGFDCNGDLLPELYLAGGASPATLLRNTGTIGGRVAFQPDTPAILAQTGVIGAYPLDADNDGILDLFILRLGQNRLLRGLGNCRFTPLPLPDSNRWTTAFSATWQAGNARPTLAIGNYVNRNDPNGPFEACDRNFLLYPKPVGYEAQPLVPAYCPLSMLFSDWNRTGTADLRISNDRQYYVRAGQEQLWQMTTPPRQYTESEGWKPYALWGMGIASRDITGHGLPEVFLSSMGDQKLQFRDPDTPGPAYHNAPYALGATAHRPYTGGDGRPSTGWQIDFGDVDNDGRDDVFIAKGNVEQMPASAMQDPDNLLMQNPDGSFTEQGAVAGVASMARGRGALLLDMNLDGLLDLVVVNRRAPVAIYQNTTARTGNWLLLDIRQPAPNTRAVGAWVEISNGTRSWHREITVGGGHASGAASLMHFGLGPYENLRLRIHWPHGETSDWTKISPNRIYRIEPAAKGLTITPL